MTRIRTIAALTVVAALAVPSAALARKVHGGTTQFALSPAASQAMNANHLVVSAIAPATASGSTITFPIARGHLNTRNLHGRIGHRGGLKISNGTRSIAIRHLEIESNNQGVTLDSLYARKLSGHGKPTRFVMVFHRVARITDISVKNRTATGTVRLTNYAAGKIDRLAGKSVAKSGTAIGTITVAPKFR